MPQFQRETFSFDPQHHPELAHWLASHSHGKRSKAIVEAIEQRAQVPDHVQIMAELHIIRELVEKLPGVLGVETEAPYEPS